MIARSFISTLQRCLPVKLSCTLEGQVRSATKLASTYKGRKRKPRPRDLGIKKWEGDEVSPGVMLVAQRGLEYHPVYNVYLNRQHNVFALKSGKVVFHYDPETDRKCVSVDDGDIPPVYPLPYFKRIISESVDVGHYLKLSTQEKMEYIKSLLNEVTERYKDELREFYMHRSTNRNTRKCTLNDISLL